LACLKLVFIAYLRLSLFPTSTMSPSVNSQTSTVPLPSQERCAPEITVISRVTSIPIISSSLSTIDDTLVSNSYTRFTYCTAKGLSTSAYNITTPLQVKLAPIICRADNFANKAVDVVESRCPYPFKAKPEEVARLVRDRRDSATKYVRERRESAVSVASKTIDEKVKLPVVHVAQGIDQVLYIFSASPPLGADVFYYFISALPPSSIIWQP
jgi:hypothetical protein